MPKFCIYDGQIATVKHALTNGGKDDIRKALEELAKVQTDYAVVGISKEDIAGKLFEERLRSIPNDAEDLAKRITDDEIAEMAGDMENSYLENGYWIDISSLGNSIKARIEQELSDERDADRSD